MGNEESKQAGAAQGQAGRKKGGGFCVGDKHVLPNQQVCASKNCKERICERCCEIDKGDKYCKMCYIAILNLNQNNNDSDDDDMAFEGSRGSIFSRESNSSAATSTFTKEGVSMNKTTGEIQGWEEFYQKLQKEDPSLPSSMAQAPSNVRLSRTPSWIVLEDQPKIDEKCIFIKDFATEEIVEVIVEKKGGSKVVFTNLPPQVDAFSYNYTDQEKWENFKEVIECLVTMHSTLTGGKAEADKEERGEVLPSTTEFKEALSKHADFKNENPSLHYDITGRYKLGSGGFAEVFKVHRKSDQKVCALKLIRNLKDEREKQLMLNEVALMNMCRDNNIVLEIYEAFDYQNMLWIFVEIMDDALTPIIAKMLTVYSENCCKYILRQSLLGLHYLHQKHIIHRDIKSDNILVDKSGQVKLADFGYSAQLTQERDVRSSKVGTVCWMAPELIRGERRYDTKVDIWSFGIFAMELANGDPPYINEPQHRVIMNIVRKNPPPIDPRWSSEFQDFVSQTLTKDPEKRPSAEVLLEHPFIKDAEQHKAEFAKLVNNFCVLRDAEKAKRRRKKETNAS